MTSKLDQIEQILAQTALMQQAHTEAIARIDTRLESLAEQTAVQQQTHTEAIARIDARLDRLAAETDRRLAAFEIALKNFTEETDRRLAALETSMDNLSRQVDNTARTVDAVGLTLENSIRHAEVDRAEIKRIWQYLMRQTPNGDSPTS